MISKINAIAFCESIIAKYKTENRNIDYLIGNEIIKFFFILNQQIRSVMHL